MADNHKSPLRPEGEDLLQVHSFTFSVSPFLTVSLPSQAALSDPFSVPDLTRASPFQHASSAPPPPPPVSTDAAPPDPSDPPAATSPESSVSPAEFDAWKAEYESQVVEWRRQSATVRARAEAERARWEERRAREQQQQQQQRRDTSDASAGQLSRTNTGTSEWESVSPGGGAAPSGAHATPASAVSAAIAAQPSAVNAAAAAAATTTTQPNPNPNVAAPSTAAAHRPAPAVADPTGSPNWENLPSSPTSSFPSMSFPEPSRPHSPERSATAPHAAPRAAGGGAAAAPLAAASATLAVFDDSLPNGTRFWALVTSLSVNMFLPFVNGVMLGFGEIFAKTVIVGWLGWGPAVATNVGLSAPSGTSRRRWWS